MPVTNLSRPFAAPANAVLWRYMSLSKLILLLRGEFYLSPISDFEDALDGMAPDDLSDAQEQAFDLVFQSIKKPEYVTDIARERRQLDRSRTQREHASLIRSLIQDVDERRRSVGGAEMFRRGIAASCWHRKSNEAIPMWEIYAGRDAGIAIKSSVARLTRALSITDVNLEMGKVLYDYEKRGSAGAEELLRAYPYFPALLKGEPFEYEAEVRVLESSGLWTSTEPTPVTVQCLPEVLIEEVVISPFVPQHVGDAIDTVVHALSAVDVVPSDLSGHYPKAWKPRYRWHGSTT